jgi:hypothetical protein
MKLDVFAGNLADPPQGLDLAIGEIIDDDDLATRVEQFNDGVAANISGAAGHEDFHAGEAGR